MTEHNNSAKTKPRVGLSACLAGDNVRYDGGNKYQPLIEQHLQTHLDLQPFCPEVAAKLGVPRPPVQLVKVENLTFALGVNDRKLDVTQALNHSSKSYLQQQSSLSGFILKSRSPSCGFGSTPIHDGTGNSIDTSNGLFAEQLGLHFPGIPIIEESWLNSGWRCRLFVACCQLAQSLSDGSQQGLLEDTNMSAQGAREMFDNLLTLTQSEARDFVASMTG
ncbi:DUF523 domain-containing protein [Porticoccus sp. W117]|uniref:DUF523 domain-containing protein n=1 Tax=Porticoccus sp. W117 TaxID=3054777 RepID=UPI002597E7DE|nr:DUF523 domain-containing protein [Porticoccus sp. W117]MDM3870950.1 DUF523 domain-containing protein [Porticoccus sp. W117]